MPYLNVPETPPQKTAHSIAEPIRAERRRSFRQPASTTGRIRIDAESVAERPQRPLDELLRDDLRPELDRTVIVSVIDISQHGVGFRTASAFDESLLYSIVIGAGPLFLNARLRIARVHRRLDGVYEIGAEFC